MKQVCGRFARPQLEQPLRGLIGEAASPEVRRVAVFSIKLQDARHQADYDLSIFFSPDEALDFWAMADSAVKTWQVEVSQTAEANIFILSLLLWKNWERERT